jgi:hypothetical protein
MKSTLMVIIQLKNEKVTIELYGFIIVFISMVATSFLTMLKYSVGKKV